ncbi:hypothetical protein F383_26759 [Gossypium arboreum]|uniref:Uncharacterized protein n=1 Tax=Gossypium arboreum TaxID=29729 RepID=A0A0B0P9N3_GOSAR|nr:hypothetical protein F383_26759 [Gossypium arboreum]
MGQLINNFGFSPGPNLISLILDLKIFKLNSFKHNFTQFSPKTQMGKLPFYP